MKRKSLKWLFRGAAILVIGWCLTSLVFSQIVLKRKVIVNVNGETGATIAATVTVDGETMYVTKELPAEFEFQAKHVLIEAKLSEAHSEGHISASLYVNDAQIGSVGAPAGQGVRVGHTAPGLWGQGKAKSWISGIPANEVAAK